MSDAAQRMDRMYAWQTRIYDVTRRPYLLGRSKLIGSLQPSPGSHVLEIGSGTGRNLIAAARRWPDADYFGLDVSDVMLEQARKEIERAGLYRRVRVAKGDAVNFDSVALYGARRFERIYFSYTLSMIPDWTSALDHAAAMLPPGGSLLIVDFGDQKGLPGFAKALLRRWLSLFHVEPRDNLNDVLRSVAARHGFDSTCASLYGGYAFFAVLQRAAPLQKD